MPQHKPLLSEDTIRWVFDVSLWFKGAFALAESIGGIALFFVSKDHLLSLAAWIANGEFVEDPHDAIVNYLLHSVQALSVGTQYFAGLYLLSHGAVKLWLIVGLLRKRLWYYPVAIAVFALFIAYQLYRFTDTHSAWLILLTFLDLIVIGLTWHEYRFLQKLHRKSL